MFDLSSTCKGYKVDKVLTYLKNDFNNVLIDIGGEIAVIMDLKMKIHGQLVLLIQTCNYQMINLLLEIEKGGS